MPILERHTTFYELWEALGVGDDCPICLLHRKRAHKFLNDFLYEKVNDAGMRSWLRDSLGFGAEACNLTAEVHDALGLSITYAALADEIQHRLAEPQPELTPTRMCPLAESMRETEARYLAEFARHYGEADPQGRHEAGFGFCLGHLREALSLLADRALRRRLALAEAQKYAALRDELRQFEAKNDYRNREPLGAEADAWQRALRKCRRPELAA